MFAFHASEAAWSDFWLFHFDGWTLKAKLFQADFFRLFTSFNPLKRKQTLRDRLLCVHLEEINEKFLIFFPSFLKHNNRPSAPLFPRCLNSWNKILHSRTMSRHRRTATHIYGSCHLLFAEVFATYLLDSASITFRHISPWTQNNADDAWLGWRRAQQDALIDRVCMSDLLYWPNSWTFHQRHAKPKPWNSASLIRKISPLFLGRLIAFRTRLAFLLRRVTRHQVEEFSPRTNRQLQHTKRESRGAMCIPKRLFFRRAVPKILSWGI